MSTQQKRQALVEALRSWQHIENRSIAQSAEIIDKTKNPVIRMVMEIIQRDSAMHHRVQQFIVDSYEKEAAGISPDELTKVWSAIESHIEAEKATNELVAKSQAALKGTKDVVQQYLLSYLAADEAKHDKLLEDLVLIKRGLYRSE